MQSRTVTEYIYLRTVLNPLGIKVYLWSLRCSTMPWHLCFFQLLINILKAQVKLHYI